MTTVDIPGGTATFRDKLTTERQRRPVKAAALAAAPIISRLPEVIGEAESARDSLAGLPISEADADAMLHLYDVTIVAFLESWTLERPLPASTDDLLDLDADVYDALQTAAQSLQADAGGAATDFSASSAEESPTTGSSS